MKRSLITIVAVLETIVLVPVNLLFFDFWFKDPHSIVIWNPIISLALLIPNILWFFLKKKDGPYRLFEVIVACAVVFAAAIVAYLVFGFLLALGNMTATGFA